MNPPYILMTLEEILARWKLLHGWEPLSGTPQGQIQRTEPQLDALLAAQIDAWYSEMLLTLPADELPLADFSASAALEILPSGAIMVRMPAKCLRPVAVKLEAWDAPAAIVEQSHPLAARQHNPFTAATPQSPVAVLRSDGNLTLYPAPAGATHTLDCLTGVEAPSKGTYRLTPRLVAMMAKTDFIYNLKKNNSL